MRYTEARLATMAEELVADIDQDTVDFEPNYDGRYQQPEILPSRLPNLLLNGSSGIAVGMATNIPPHNLEEIVDAAVLLIENPQATLDDLLEIINGPDFPTAGIALVGKEREQIRHAYGEGHGRVTVHARTAVEESARGRTQIIITELPYQVNKASLIEKIANLVREKKIEGIADLRDESDRDGMRVVIELKREGSAQQIKNLLYKHTAMRSTFAINMMAIVDGAPRRVGLKRALDLFLDHRREVIRRRTESSWRRPASASTSSPAPARHRPARRGDRHHPRRRVGGGGARPAPGRALRVLRGPGPRHPRHAAAPPRRPRTPGTPGRAPGADRAHRLP